MRRFVAGFTVLFVVTWAAWIVGNELHLTMVDAAVDGRNRYTEAGLTWGLQLGEGAPYLLALIAGLAIGNFAQRFAATRLAEAARPEWYIKTAIVFLGVNLGAQTVEASGFAFDLILTGAAATFVAYLFFWPIVYAAARRLFGFKRDVAAVLASGISVCGVSAAIATAGAIRAKPVIPVTISMVVVIFAMIELIVLPGFYTALLPDQPIVNGAALGMTVKTDGADAAAGALLDELMITRHLQLTGEQWQAGWILSASLLTKIWIDVFIGVWAFLLAIVWIRKVEKRVRRRRRQRDGDLVSLPEIRPRLLSCVVRLSRDRDALADADGRARRRHGGRAEPDAHDAVHVDVRRDGCDHGLRQAEGHGQGGVAVRARARGRDCADRLRRRLLVPSRPCAAVGRAMMPAARAFARVGP